MPPIGAGLCPVGMTPVGYGVPDRAPDGRGIPFRDPATGATLDARRIDISTGQPMFGDDGHVLGMTSAQHLMVLALSTEKGTSAMVSLGVELRAVKSFTRSFDRRVRDTITSAIAHLTQNKIVELIGVEIARVGKTAAVIRVRWRDLSTMKEYTETLS